MNSPGFALTCHLEAALLRGWGTHRTGRKGGGVDSAGDAVRAAVGGLVGFRIEGRPADHLEGHEMAVHGMGVPGHIDAYPVLHRADLRCLRYRSRVEVHAVQVEVPFDLLGSICST